MNRPILRTIFFFLRGLRVVRGSRCGCCEDCAFLGADDVAVVGVFVLMVGPPSCVSPVFAPGFGAVPDTLAFAACSKRVRVNLTMLPLMGVTMRAGKCSAATVHAQLAVLISIAFDGCFAAGVVISMSGGEPRMLRNLQRARRACRRRQGSPSLPYNQGSSVKERRRHVRKAHKKGEAVMIVSSLDPLNYRNYRYVRTASSLVTYSTDLRCRIDRHPDRRVLQRG